MTAAPKDITIEQGATFTLGWNWHREGDPDPVTGEPTPGDPYDLTGCVARMQIRKKQGDPVLLTATSEPVPADDPERAAAIAAGAGRIRLGTTDGRIDIELTDEDTDLLSSRNAAYDFEIEWPIQAGQIRPRVDRLLQGTVTVDPNVTQVSVLDTPLVAPEPTDDPLVT